MRLENDLQMDTAEAEKRAAKKIAQLLQRPDQLDKVKQYKKGIARKRMGVESRLKTAVQSQLDGVRFGIDQLNSAIENVREVRKTMTTVETMMESAFHDKHIREIKDISAEHRQLSSAMDNLRQIFTVPESVEAARAQLREDKLLEAHKTIRELEMSRDELLYEQHKLENGSQGDVTLLNRYFQDVATVSGELLRKISAIVGDSFSISKTKPELLVSALRIIEREHAIDQETSRRKTYSGFNPPGRPKEWRESVLESLKASIEVKFRIEAKEGDGWLGGQLRKTGMQSVSDLIMLKHAVAPCFPPVYNIFERFTNWYHMAFAAEVNRIVKEGLEGKQIIEILIFSNIYGNENYLGNPELGIVKERIPELLDGSEQQALINVYIGSTRENIREWLKKAMVQEAQEWRKQDPPIGDADGYFCTDLPVILAQMIAEILNVTKQISDDLKNRIFGDIVLEMKNFFELLIEALSDFKTQHLRTRNAAPWYHNYCVATINNCKTLSDNFDDIKAKFEIDTKDGPAFESPIYKIAEDAAQRGCSFLVEEVMMDLAPTLGNIMTKNEWLESSGTPGGRPVDTIVATATDYSKDFASLRPEYLFSLIKELERLVTLRYVSAIILPSSGKIKFSASGYENDSERREVSDQLTIEADYLGRYFKELSNSRDNATAPTDVIRSVADLLKSSPDMIELELSSMVGRYADLTADHIKSLLTLRGDISSAEIRSSTLSAMNQKRQPNDYPSIFGEIQISTSGIFR